LATPIAEHPGQAENVSDKVSENKIEGFRAAIENFKAKLRIW
jgi:hypothetical protein